MPKPVSIDALNSSRGFIIIFVKIDQKKMQLKYQTNRHQPLQSEFITTKNFSRTLRADQPDIILGRAKTLPVVFMSAFRCEKALSTSFFPRSSHTLTWKFTSMEDGRQQIIRWSLVARWGTRSPRFHASCGSDRRPSARPDQLFTN